jgi:hypothetical protein
LTERDLRLLRFAAEHRLIRRSQVEVLLGVSAGRASARLRALTGSGYLVKQQPFAYQQACYQIGGRGLGVIESRLPRPRGIDLRGYRHDIGLGWIWLAARAGAYGKLSQLISEREMRSRDPGIKSANDRFGLRTYSEGPRGGDRTHYPDMLMELKTGHRVAVELELTPKGRRRLDRIMRSYAGDSRIDAVLYLVEDDRVAHAVQASARKAGISKLVHVQRVAFTEATGLRGSSRTATRSRSADRGVAR